jgi:hypothetical protein
LPPPRAEAPVVATKPIMVTISNAKTALRNIVSFLVSIAISGIAVGGRRLILAGCTLAIVGGFGVLLKQKPRSSSTTNEHPRRLRSSHDPSRDRAGHEGDQREMTWSVLPGPSLHCKPRPRRVECKRLNVRLVLGAYLTAGMLDAAMRLLRRKSVFGDA